VPIIPLNDFAAKKKHINSRDELGNAPMKFRSATVESSIKNFDLVAGEETLNPLRNEEAFTNFYLKTVRPFWTYLARVSGSAALADDLVQESYLRFLCANAPWDAGEEACRRYLFRIGTNLMRDQKRRPAAASLQDVPEPLMPAVNPISMESLDSNAQLHSALMHLRPVERQLLWLAHAEGYSHREIAEVTGLGATQIGEAPRTHRLALLAAREALGQGPPPDAIVLGTTTGGIAATEEALKAGSTLPGDYRYHGLDTVALFLADALHVHGPVLTLSTACSSAAVAMSVAQALLRAGLARRVLAGGADSLCRLTFHGFRALQLLAPGGCTPLDANRAGMTVGEGAGFLVLETAPEDRQVLALLSGTGLSCDAYHAASPHPEGAGAARAMRRAWPSSSLALRRRSVAASSLPMRSASCSMWIEGRLERSEGEAGVWTVTRSPVAVSVSTPFTKKRRAPEQVQRAVPRSCPPRSPSKTFTRSTFWPLAFASASTPSQASTTT